MSMDEAKAKRCDGILGDKYGDVVRVVEVPGSPLNYVAVLMW